MNPDSERTSVEELLPLSPPVFHVLLALGTDTLHGYAMIEAFEGLTGGSDRLLPGTLYATLARMVETGLIAEAPAPEPGADARRRYYRVTPLGRRVCAAEGERMRRLLGVAESQRVATEGAG
jgi:DNA-binding PadR family transcriptional regulator